MQRILFGSVVAFNSLRAHICLVVTGSYLKTLHHLFRCPKRNSGSYCFSCLTKYEMKTDRNQAGLVQAIAEARRRHPEEVLNCILFTLFFRLPHDISLLILITDCQGRYFYQSSILENGRSYML